MNMKTQNIIGFSYHQSIFPEHINITIEENYHMIR